MFEIVFLGTSASAPSAQRGLSSAIILCNDQRFMIDCGEGTQRQILRSGLGFRRLDKILLTHSHLDHILGLGGLASTLGRWETLDELNIYGSETTLRRVGLLMEVVFGSNQEARVGVSLNKIQEGLLFEGKKFTLHAFPVKHRGDGCFGFTFEESAHRPFLAEKADAIGLPHGPGRRDLVAGKPFSLPDGRLIQPDDVLGTPEPGTKLCFIGDVSHTGPLHKMAEGADLLAIEATYLDADKDLARQNGHITAKAAARLAKKANVKQLVLHHISRRYHAQEVLAEAQETFPNTHVADDLDLVRVQRGKVAKITNCRNR